MNIPKEIVNEIAEFVQPKYKCVRIEYTYIKRHFNDNDEDYDGFKVEHGKKIFILDYKSIPPATKIDFLFLFTDLECDTIGCNDWENTGCKELKRIMGDELNRQRTSGDHGDYGEYRGIFDEYLMYKVVERF
jgi:hypothetical protein